MELVPKKDSEQNDIGDITNKLPSLQFESALSGDEKAELVLRKRSHAITVAGSAQATYLVSVLNEARYKIEQNFCIMTSFCFAFVRDLSE